MTPFNLKRNMKERCSYHEDHTMTHSIWNTTWGRDALITKTVPWPIQFEVQHEGEMLLSWRPHHDPFNLKCTMKERCAYHKDHTMTHSIWSMTWRKYALITKTTQSIWSTTWMKDALITKTTPWPVQFEAPHEGEIHVTNVYHDNLTPGYNHPW